MPPSPQQPRTKPVRLGVVCGQLEIGGQETGMLELLRRLDRRRFSPVVYAFRPGPLLRHLRAQGIRVVVGSARPNADRPWTRRDAIARVAFRRTLADAFRREGIDVCLVYAWADAVAAAREVGVPAIVERVDGPKLVGWVRDKSSCETLICESRAIVRLLGAQRELLRTKGVRAAVIPNGVDLKRFDPARYDRRRSRSRLGIGPADFVVGTVARLAPVKNIEHLLEACRLLVDRVGAMVPLRIVIAGPDGGAEASLRQAARRLGLADRTQFLGARADVPRILRALDVFVLVSLQEGVPFALVEAMAMALPVVATQADGIAETVADNGYLVSPLDPLRTTLALKELAVNAALRRALGERSRQLARGHDIDRMVRGYERVLMDAFRSGSAKPPVRRRIVLMPGHPAARKGAGTLRSLFHPLRRAGADVYVLDVDTAGRNLQAAWPPPRQQRFDAIEGWPRRRAALEWIQPDLVITDCPWVALGVRQCLPGEELVYVADRHDPCPGHVSAARAADRLLVESEDEHRALARRWPSLAWKIARSEGARSRGDALLSLVATARPRRGKADRP